MISRKPYLLVWILLAILPLLAVSDSPLSPIETAILNDSSSFFFVDRYNYPVHNPQLPIGIFDSGTGGLTVLDAIVHFDSYDNRTRQYRNGGDQIPDFQQEYFLYLGDQANMPYGNYARENKTELLVEHILKDVQFLLGNQYYAYATAPAPSVDKSPVKAIIIACNTATAFGKQKIEQFLDRAQLDIQVIGVIGAGVRGALHEIPSDENASIAVLATAGTVSSGGYRAELEGQLDRLGYSGEVGIFQQAGIGLAAAIDASFEYLDPNATRPRPEYQGPSLQHPSARIDPILLSRYGFDWDGNRMLWQGNRQAPEKLQINSVDNYIAYHLLSLMEQIRTNGKAAPLRAVILGCTHYPFYMEQFARHIRRLYDYREDGQYIYRPCMSDSIVFIDPAINTAVELYDFLATQELLNRADLKQSEFYISIPNRRNPQIKIDNRGNFTYAYKYGRAAGQIQEYVRRVPFSRQSLPADIIDRLSQKMPSVFLLIQYFNQNSEKMDGLPSDQRIQ